MGRMPIINLLFEPKFKEPPILIAGFPGIASIGKITVDHLIDSLKTEPFLELYSEYLPEWTIKQEDGSLDGIKVRFYAYPEGNLILLTADAQAPTPYGQYILTEQILELAKKFGVKLVITAAAYVLAEREKRKPVVGAATDRKTVEWLKEHDVELLESGVIVGMNGLLPCLSPLWGISGVCLLGTTKGELVDANGAKAVLKVICKMLGLKVNLDNLEEKYLLPTYPRLEIKLPGEEEETDYIR